MAHMGNVLFNGVAVTDIGIVSERRPLSALCDVTEVQWRPLIGNYPEQIKLGEVGAERAV